MHKITTFFRTFIKTISEPDYYNDIVTARLSFSIKYFLLFYVLLASASAITFNFRTKPAIQTFTRNLVHNLTTNYPSSLELKLDNGQLAVSGVTQPYLVSFPPELLDFGNQNQYDYLLAIDSTSSSAYKNTLVTLTNTQMIVRQPDGDKQTLPLSEFGGPITLNKAGVELASSAMQSKIDRLISFLPWLLLVLLMIFLPLISALVLTFYSVFTYFISSIFKKKLSYKKAYQIGLHTITFAEFAQFLQNTLFPNSALPNIFPLAFFGATFMAVYALRNTPKKY